MRRFVDLLAVLTLIGLGAAIFYSHKDRYDHDQAIDQVAEAVRMFDLKIKYHAATEGAELTARGWPVTIDPAWFEGAVPRNTLVSGDRPWLEIAGPEDAELQHPRLRMTVDSSVASFWYNPYNGALRARVPVTTSDAEALETYNLVNHANLTSIFDLTAPRSAPASAEEPQEQSEPEQDDMIYKPTTATVPDRN
ncbi:MAG: hypothetical protein ACF8R7_12960 [Phycisphaerales bacterium JB039]